MYIYVIHNLISRIRILYIFIYLLHTHVCVTYVNDIHACLVMSSVNVVNNESLPVKHFDSPPVKHLKHQPISVSNGTICRGCDFGLLAELEDPDVRCPQM